jgi:hypothetical protein
MGCLLMKATAIELANDLIQDADFQSEIVKCKEVRKLKAFCSPSLQGHPNSKWIHSYEFETQN